MPLVVLLVAYTLHDFHDSAKTSTGQTQSHSPASATSDSTDP